MPQLFETPEDFSVAKLAFLDYSATHTDLFPLYAGVVEQRVDVRGISQKCGPKLDQTMDRRGELLLMKCLNTAG